MLKNTVCGYVNLTFTLHNILNATIKGGYLLSRSWNISEAQRARAKALSSSFRLELSCSVSVLSSNVHPLLPRALPVAVI